MEYEKHTLTSSSGTSLQAGLNGTSYVIPEKINDSILAQFTGIVFDTNNDTGEIVQFDHVREAVQYHGPDGWYVVLMHKTAQEIHDEAVAADTELMLETAADHEYRICLMELGVTEDDL